MITSIGLRLTFHKLHLAAEKLKLLLIFICIVFPLVTCRAPCYKVLNDI